MGDWLISLILAIFPLTAVFGVCDWYNGKKKEAIIHTVLGVIGLIIYPFFGYLLWLASWIFSLVEAYWIFSGSYKDGEGNDLVKS